jgi:hypothetical protein
MGTMIRIAAIAAALLLPATCSGHSSGGGSTAPPAATATTGGHTTRLELGSFCWSTPSSQACGDTGDPSTIPGLPVVHAKAGATIVVRLRFDPTKVDVALGQTHVPVAAGRTLRIPVSHPGLLVVDAFHGSDDASYLARVRLSR